MNGFRLLIHGVHDLLLLLRLELRAVVEVDNALVADVRHHVNLAVAVDILKLQRHRYGDPTVCIDCRARINPGAGTIAARQFDNSDAGIQVDRHKMCGVIG